MPSVPNGLDTDSDEQPKRSDGFARNREQAIGSTKDISAAVEREQRSDSARNGRTRQ